MNDHAAPVDLFERQWQTYRDVIDHDWMEHRGLTAACADWLGTWMAEHPERRGAARLLDLGCGDLALMGPVFAALPLAGYTGIDLTEQVLPMARTALAGAGFPARFQHADITEFIDRTDETFDLVHAALVLHHLPDDAKAAFLAGLRRVVAAGGAVLWADVFRDPGESRANYVDRYARRIRRDWSAIDHDAREAIVTHMSSFDFPADRDAVVETARKTGWQWQWLWQGSHRAEAVAVLTAA